MRGVYRLPGGETVLATTAATGVLELRELGSQRAWHSNSQGKLFQAFWFGLFRTQGQPAGFEVDVLQPCTVEESEELRIRLLAQWTDFTKMATSYLMINPSCRTLEKCPQPDVAEWLRQIASDLQRPGPLDDEGQRAFDLLAMLAFHSQDWAEVVRASREQVSPWLRPFSSGRFHLMPDGALVVAKICDEELKLRELDLYGRTWVSDAAGPLLLIKGPKGEIEPPRVENFGPREVRSCEPKEARALLRKIDIFAIEDAILRIIDRVARGKGLSKVGSLRAAARKPNPRKPWTHAERNNVLELVKSLNKSGGSGGRLMDVLSLLADHHTLRPQKAKRPL